MTLQLLFVIFTLTPYIVALFAIFWIKSIWSVISTQEKPLPTPWLLLVPFFTVWWAWKFSKAYAPYTGGTYSWLECFFIVGFFGGTGVFILRESYKPKLFPVQNPSAMVTVEMPHTDSGKQSGFITMIVIMLIILIAAITLAYMRVKNAN